MMTIGLKEILRQAHEDIAILECLSPMTDNRPDPAFILYFRGLNEEGVIDPRPELRGATGWFYMRMWLTVTHSSGYLRDTKCHYNLVKDITTLEFCDGMREIYTMRKLGGDSLVIPETSRYGLIDRIMDLAYNRSFPHLGYYPLKSRLLSTNEARP